MVVSAYPFGMSSKFSNALLSVDLLSSLYSGARGVVDAETAAVGDPDTVDLVAVLVPDETATLGAPDAPQPATATTQAAAAAIGTMFLMGSSNKRGHSAYRGR